MPEPKALLSRSPLSPEGALQQSPWWSEAQLWETRDYLGPALKGRRSKIVSAFQGFPSHAP
jgi:hypothetical protein